MRRYTAKRIQVIIKGGTKGQKKDLRSADLSFADLSSADLRSANLRFANLRSADLRSADLSSADLSFANLRSADLRFANLSFADLSSADLRSANLRFANLRSTKNFTNITNICPDGSFTAYKKGVYNMQEYIIKLKIPAKALRVNAYSSRKIRVSEAKVVAIFNLDGTRSYCSNVTGKNNPGAIYKIGTTVKPDKFDADPIVECSNGIHCFLTRKEAEVW